MGSSDARFTAGVLRGAHPFRGPSIARVSPTIPKPRDLVDVGRRAPEPVTTIATGCLVYRRADSTEKPGGWDFATREARIRGDWKHGPGASARVMMGPG